MLGASTDYTFFVRSPFLTIRLQRLPMQRPAWFVSEQTENHVHCRLFVANVVLSPLRPVNPRRHSPCSHVRVSRPCTRNKHKGNLPFIRSPKRSADRPKVVPRKNVHCAHHQPPTVITVSFYYANRFSLLSARQRRRESRCAGVEWDKADWVGVGGVQRYPIRRSNALDSLFSVAVVFCCSTRTDPSDLTFPWPPLSLPLPHSLSLSRLTGHHSPHSNVHVRQ